MPVVDVPDNKSLGEWAGHCLCTFTSLHDIPCSGGLCKIDKDGLPRKAATHQMSAVTFVIVLPGRWLAPVVWPWWILVRRARTVVDVALAAKRMRLDMLGNGRPTIT